MPRLQDFAAMAEYVFGRGWKPSLAEGLGVNARTIRRWMEGVNPIPQGIWEAVVILAAEKQLPEILQTMADVKKSRGILPEMLTLSVSGIDSKVQSIIHHRPWTAITDFEIKQKIAEKLEGLGYNVEVEKI